MHLSTMGWFYAMRLLFRPISALSGKAHRYTSLSDRKWYSLKKHAGPQFVSSILDPLHRREIACVKLNDHVSNWMCQIETNKLKYLRTLGHVLIRHSLTNKFEWKSIPLSNHISNLNINRSWPRMISPDEQQKRSYQEVLNFEQAKAKTSNYETIFRSHGSLSWNFCCSSFKKALWVAPKSRHNQGKWEGTSNAVRSHDRVGVSKYGNTYNEWLNTQQHNKQQFNFLVVKL